MRPDVVGASCPGDELLAAFVDGRVAAHRRADVERHVAACPVCLDVVAASLTPGTEVACAPVAEAEPNDVGRHAPSTPWRTWAIAASVVLTLGASLFAMRERFVAPMMPTLARLGTRLLGLPVQAEAVDIRLGDAPGTFVVAFRDVTVGTIGRRYHADEIGMTMTFAAPFVGDAPVQSVRITRPIVDLVGRDPKDIIASRGERSKAIELLGQANRVEVENARILLAGPDGTPFVVEGIVGGIERTAVGARLAFRGRAAGGDVDLVGTLAGDARDVTLTIGGRALDATALPLLRAGLKGVVDLRMDVRAVGGDVRVDGRISIRNGALLGRGAATLPQLSPESRTALAARDAALAGADLPFEDARAMFAWRGRSWRIERLYATSHGIIVGGRAAIGATGALRGHGTLRVPADLVTVLESHEPALAPFRDAGGTATLPVSLGGTLADPDVMVRKR
jgi:hypothetical protein